MKLTVTQNQQYESKDWWKWAVWIEGPDEDLAQIERVTYKLHPTFPHPLRTTNDVQSKFKLESAGWGTFPIQVKVELKNGDAVKLTHELALSYPDSRAAPA